MNESVESATGIDYVSGLLCQYCKMVHEHVRSALPWSATSP